MGHAQTTWTLSCLDTLGEEVLVYQYRNDAPGIWTWELHAQHRCAFKACLYRAGMLIQPCDSCESIKASLTMHLGLVLLYDSGYFQEIVVQEEREQRTYTVNPAGKMQDENETTREVKVRRIRKDVLHKELGTQTTRAYPRESWLQKHPSEDVETIWKLRTPFLRRTPKGKVIQVTPTQPMRIHRLKRRPDRTVVELVTHRKKDSQEEKHTDKL